MNSPNRWRRNRFRGAIRFGCWALPWPVRSSPHSGCGTPRLADLIPARPSAINVRNGRGINVSPLAGRACKPAGESVGLAAASTAATARKVVAAARAAATRKHVAATTAPISPLTSETAARAATTVRPIRGSKATPCAAPAPVNTASVRLWSTTTGTTTIAAVAATSARGDLLAPLASAAAQAAATVSSAARRRRGRSTTGISVLEKVGSRMSVAIPISGRLFHHWSSVRIGFRHAEVRPLPR